MVQAWIARTFAPTNSMPAKEKDVKAAWKNRFGGSLQEVTVQMRDQGFIFGNPQFRGIRYATFKFAGQPPLGGRKMVKFAE